MSFFESVYRFLGWWIINIDILFLVFLLIGAGLLTLKQKSWGKKFIVSACFGFTFFGIVPLGMWTFTHLENRFPKLDHIPVDAKGVILLGGSFDKITTDSRGETAYNQAAGKFIRFVELAKAAPHLRLAFTGTPFEVETAKIEFAALGLDSARVIFEDKSKNTRDNARKSALLLQPTPDEKWVLVTSAYHMPRSVGLFRKAGFNVIPFPTDYHTTGRYEPQFFLGLPLNLQAWAASSREWLGMIINRILGYSDDVLPAPFVYSQDPT